MPKLAIRTKSGDLLHTATDTPSAERLRAMLQCSSLDVVGLALTDGATCDLRISEIESITVRPEPRPVSRDLASASAYPDSFPST